MPLKSLTQQLLKPFQSEKLIHSCEDAWGTIQVHDQGPHRILSFGSIFEQSKVDLAAPQRLVHEYTRVMLLALAFNSPRHATILGLGGGALVNCMLQLQPDCQLDVVELRESVVRVAQEYFALPTHPQLAIHVADARDHLPSCDNASTDLLFADLYFAENMNPYQAQKKFLGHCARVLRPDGWLVINFHRLPSLNTPFFRWILAEFPTLLVCSTTSGNQVLFAGKTLMLDPREKRQQVRELETASGMQLGKLLERMIRIRF